ncbi:MULTISPECIES: hypothetical protein [unclassified Kitasatospora]|uniref:hypothetical protein n=1 Tax=unclassified Kitasatospora TaxID=2633591 RepID=UPI003656D155
MLPIRGTLDGESVAVNAALLCHLAGAAHVTTIDRTERLVSTARTRLAEAGFRPSVLRTDGQDGCPDRVPFDRIIATCSVRRIPRAWLDQCAPGGLIVAPIADALGGGAGARLTKLPDGRAVGRFLHQPAAFMPLRSADEPGPPAPEPGAGGRTTATGSRVLDDHRFSFWAGLHLGPTVVRCGSTLHDPADGSVAYVQDDTVLVSGPRDLWQLIEAAHRSWLDHNRPRREWFTVEAGPEGLLVGYTAPDGSSTRWSS